MLKHNSQYIQALEVYRDSLYIFQQIEPHPHGYIISCQGAIGDIYFAKNEYQDAEAFYSTAFASAKRYLFSGDDHLIRCIVALANVYEKQDNGIRTRSIDFCQQELVLQRSHLPDNHFSLAHILMKLGQLLDRIDYYNEALMIINNNISQGYEFKANCLMLMAEYYHGREMHGQALRFYREAHIIQTKIYPENHSLIVNSKTLIMDTERRITKQYCTVEMNLPNHNL